MKHSRNFSHRIFSFVVSGLCCAASLPALAAVSNVPSSRATYNGLVFAEDAAVPHRTGYFKLDVSPGGQFTGKLLIGQRRPGFSGRFNDSGQAFVRVSVKTGDFEVIQKPDGSTDYREVKKVMWTLVLQLTNGVYDVSGQIISYQGAGWSGIVMGQRAAYNARTNPAPQSGRYTVAFPEDPDSQTGPAGDGWSALTVDEAGNVLLQGALPDNSRFTASSILSADGA